jgi:hypothetical protein
MTFKENGVETFLENFNTNKEKIRAVEGCEHLELLNDVENENIFFTYSYWQSVDHLNQYRDSNLFKTIWKNTKIHFSEKPQAWSVRRKTSV